MKRLLYFPLILLIVASLTGCGGLTKLNQPVNGLVTLPAEVTAGETCRQIEGTIDAQSVAGVHGEGFRCVAFGKQDFKGCITWVDGGLTYKSPGCFTAPGDLKEAKPGATPATQ